MSDAHITDSHDDNTEQLSCDLMTNIRANPCDTNIHHNLSFACGGGLFVGVY